MPNMDGKNQMGQYKTLRPSGENRFGASVLGSTAKWNFRQVGKGAFNNYVDKMRGGGGQKMST